MGTSLEQRTQRGDQSIHISRLGLKDRTIGNSVSQIQHKIHFLLFHPATQHLIMERASKYYDLRMKQIDILSKTNQLEEEIAKALQYVSTPILADQETTEVPIVQAYDFKDYKLASVVDVLADKTGMSREPSQTLITHNQHNEPILETSYYALNGIPPIVTQHGEWQIHLTETTYTGNRGQRIIIDEETELQMHEGMESFHSLILAKTQPPKDATAIPGD